MRGKNIGIVTLYRGYNYGTSLQAYALKKVISELGYNAQIIWTAENTAAGRDIRLGKIFRILRRCIVHPSLFKRTFFAYKNSLTIEIPVEIKKQFLDFTQQKLQVRGMPMKELKQFAADPQTCAVVCGSDQIWSAANANVEPLYFLRFVPKHKRVSYAPSFGSSNVPQYNRKLIQKYLRDFACISVRETQGAAIVKELIGREVPAVLDPTLLYDWAEWKSPTTVQDYVVAYFLNEPTSNAVESLRALSRRYDCDIVAFPYHHKAYEGLNRIRYPEIGPREFVDIIANAKCVCTDSFHGTAFSVNLQVPFWTFARNYGGAAEQSSRITSLLEMLQLENQYVADQTPRSVIPALDMPAVQVRLGEKRIASINYLIDAFKNIRGV